MSLKTSKEELDLVKLCKLTQIVRMLYGVQPAQLLFEKYLKDITGLTKNDLFNRLKTNQQVSNKE